MQQTAREISLGSHHYEVLRSLAQQQTRHGLYEELLASEPSGDQVLVRLLPRGSSLERHVQQQLPVLQKLQHASVRPVLAAGRQEQHLAVVYGWKEGVTLEAVLGWSALSRQRLSPAFACHVASRVADALHAFHEHEVEEAVHPPGGPHRGVCPQHVFIGLDGEVLLDGFEGVGSVDYAAPEYLKEQRGDRRADIYSLGLVLLEMLTGVHPLDEPEEVESDLEEEARDELSGAAPLGERMTGELGLSEQALLLRMQRLVPKRVRRRAQGVPEGVVAMVQRALQFHPEHRYSTAAELRDALEDWVLMEGHGHGPLGVADTLAHLRQEASARCDEAEVEGGLMVASLPAQPLE
jgi:eukaryotic-like serine/threonine-protein kinase